MQFFLYFDDPVVITKYCLCITKMTAFVMKKPRKCAETVIVISYNTTPRLILRIYFRIVYNLFLIIFVLYVLRKLPHRM